MELEKTFDFSGKLLITCLLCGALPACKPVKKNQHFWWGMDTNFSLTMYGSGNVSPAQAYRLLERETHRLEKVFSDYDSASYLSGVRGDSGKILQLNSEVYGLLEFAVAMSLHSRGAFNINLHKLKALWGLGTGETPRVPSKQEIMEAVQEARSSDTSFPILLLGNNRIQINQAHVFLDLGAVVKGYTADRLDRLLDSLGYPVHLVTVGGEVHTSGEKPGGPWHIGVRHPRSRQKNIYSAVISQTGKGAVSTSGDYERFFIQDGVRYHHIFDPRSGYPAREFCSVTVTAPESRVTDALSTSLFVLGPEAGTELLHRYGAEAMWLKEAADGLCAITTPGMPARIKQLNIPHCPEELP